MEMACVIEKPEARMQIFVHTPQSNSTIKFLLHLFR